jgi:hypothetical protein
MHIWIRNTAFSVPWNKNRNIPSFRSEAVSEEDILFVAAGFFFLLIFFMPFPSVSGIGIDSSVNLGMSRNPEHFLPPNNGNHSESIPRNNGNHSESIPRNFSERSSVANPSPRCNQT